MDFLGGAGVGLQGGVPQLHDVTRSGEIQRPIGEVPMHHMPTTGAEAQIHSRGVDHHFIPNVDHAVELGEIVCTRTIIQLDPLQAGPLGHDLAHHQRAERGHGLQRRDELLNPLVARLERVLAQHRSLRLIV